MVFSSTFNNILVIFWRSVLLVIGTDCISSYKSNYHTITTTTVLNDRLIKEHRDLTCWVIDGFKILFILFSARSLYWM